MAAIEIEQTIRRLASHRGVEGLVIFTADGVAFRSTLSRELTKQYSGLIAQLVAKARSTVRTIDPDNDLQFLRVRTRKHELMIGSDQDFILLVIQNPSAGDLSDIMPTLGTQTARKTN